MEIETDEEDPGRTELCGEVHGLKAGVAREADLAGRVELHEFRSGQRAHLHDIRCQSGRPAILRYSKPAESSAGFFVLSPPSEVA